MSDPIHISLEEASAMAERMKMALMEAGYPNPIILIGSLDDDAEGMPVSGWGPVVDPCSVNNDTEACYKAFRISLPRGAEHTIACWKCFEKDNITTRDEACPTMMACLAGNCEFEEAQ